MPFILITADFPEMEPVGITRIFSLLEEHNWVKLHDHDSRTNTIWFRAAQPAQPDDAIRAARHNFTACCIPLCIPRLTVEWRESTIKTPSPMLY